MAKLDRDAEWANRARVGSEQVVIQWARVLSDSARAKVAAALDSTIGNGASFEWRDGMKPWFSVGDTPVRPSQWEIAALGKWYFARPGVNIPTLAEPDARH